MFCLIYASIKSVPMTPLACDREDNIEMFGILS